MKKSYSGLTTVSIISIVFGYVWVVLGMIIGIFYLYYYSQNTNPVTGIFALSVSILAGFAIALPFWAMGQFIKLWISVANDISTTNENIYYMAERLSKKGGNTL